MKIFAIATAIVVINIIFMSSYTTRHYELYGNETLDILFNTNLFRNILPESRFENLIFSLRQLISLGFMDSLKTPMILDSI